MTETLGKQSLQLKQTGCRCLETGDETLSPHFCALDDDDPCVPSSGLFFPFGHISFIGTSFLAAKGGGDDCFSEP